MQQTSANDVEMYSKNKLIPFAGNIKAILKRFIAWPELTFTRCETKLKLMRKPELGNNRKNSNEYVKQKSETNIKVFGNGNRSLKFGIYPLRKAERDFFYEVFSSEE